MTLLQATTDFTVAMKNLKKIVAETKWCCPGHKMVAVAQIAIFSQVKNNAYAAYKAGTMTEVDFIAFINEGTVEVNAFAAKTAEDVEVRTSINMPAPAEVA